MEEEKEFDFGKVISTGSTLLDLAISGTAVRGGGIPGGILVEIFGPSGAGKTILLCELAGAIERQGGETYFFDPEARLGKQFAKVFDFHIKEDQYFTPNTVTEVFQHIRKIAPEDTSTITGILTDSLAALSTNMEMDGEDKYGMRRAKEFSEELRKTCRIIKERNLLLVCSNQIRENVGGGLYEAKYKSSGGMGIPFYASLRLQCSNPTKIKKEKTINGGKKISRVIGVETTITVAKSSIDVPHRTAVIPIVFSYGIDNLRQNLQFIKSNSTDKFYTIGGEKLSNDLDKACTMIEDSNLENELKEEVIDTWEAIESSFHKSRKKKIR